MCIRDSSCSQWLPEAQPVPRFADTALYVAAGLQLQPLIRVSCEGCRSLASLHMKLRCCTENGKQ
eukprot:11503042-Alexandrium_andersonii.AAC.1